MTIRVLLADDHAIMRDGLKSILTAEPDIEVVAEAETGLDAVRLAGEVGPDVVVMDVNMPDLNGADATREILKAVPTAKVVALSVHMDRQIVARMLDAGASGYLPKTCTADELVRAIHSILRAGVYLSPEVQAVLVNGLIGSLRGEEFRPAQDLTPRELQVLQLVAEGNTNKQVAAKLGLSFKTVETHRRHIMDKLDLHDVASLTKYAIRAGLTTLGQ